MVIGISLRTWQAYALNNSVALQTLSQRVASLLAGKASAAPDAALKGA